MLGPSTLPCDLQNYAGFTVQQQMYALAEPGRVAIKSSLI